MTRTIPAADIAADGRFRNALVILTYEGPSIDDHPAAAARVEVFVEAIAADYCVDGYDVFDLLAGALWGGQDRTDCAGCGWDEYAPACPSCLVDAYQPLA